MLNKLIKEILELCIIECKKTHNFLKIETAFSDFLQEVKRKSFENSKS